MSHEEGGDKSSSLLERLRERAEWERTHEEMDSPYAQLVSAAADRIEHLEAELYDTPRSSVAENDLGDLTQACVEEFEKSLGRNLPGRQTAIIRKHIEKALSLRSAIAESDKARLDWLEKNHTLHNNVEILYVVDGYEVVPMHEDGITELRPRAHGEDLRAALDAAMKLDGYVPQGGKDG